MRAETLHSLDVLQDFGDNTQGHPRVWRVPRLPPAAGSAPPPGVSVLARAVRVLDDDVFRHFGYPFRMRRLDTVMKLHVAMRTTAARHTVDTRTRR